MTNITVRVNDSVKVSVLIGDQFNARPDDLRRGAQVLLFVADAVEKSMGKLDRKMLRKAMAHVIPTDTTEPDHD